MKELRELINKTPLTKTQKMIAQYILDNSADACFMTSTEIALKLGVSESSVIRFSRSLGFSGFMDFQKSLRRDYQDKVLSISSSITIPSQRIAKRAQLTSSAEYINRHLKNAAKNLENALTSNRPEAFEEAADIILASRHKYITASRGNCLPRGLFSSLFETHGSQRGDDQLLRHQPGGPPVQHFKRRLPHHVQLPPVFLRG